MFFSFGLLALNQLPRDYRPLRKIRYQHRSFLQHCIILWPVLQTSDINLTFFFKLNKTFRKYFFPRGYEIVLFVTTEGARVALLSASGPRHNQSFRCGLRLLRSLRDYRFFPPVGSASPAAISTIKNSGIRKFENAKIRKFNNSKIPYFKNWKIQKYENSKMQKSENSIIRKFDTLKIGKFKNSTVR